MTEEPASVVYIVRIGRFAKIGFSTNLPERLKSFATHSAEEIELLWSYPGGRNEERRLHTAVDHIRLSRGEFFHLDARIETFIVCMANRQESRAWEWLEAMRPERCEERRQEESARRLADRRAKDAAVTSHYRRLVADRKRRMGW